MDMTPRLGSRFLQAVRVCAGWIGPRVHSLVWNSFALGLLVAFMLQARPGADVALMSLHIVGAGLCALVGNVQRFEFFKMLGLEARTREVISEAENTGAALRKLAAELGSVLLYANAAHGRWAGRGDASERDAKRAAVLTSLKSAGVPDEQLRIVSSADRRFVIADYASGVLQAVRYDANAEVRAMDELWDETGEPPTPESLRTLLRSIPNCSQFANELVADLEYYIAQGTHRRPDVWAARERWQISKPPS